MADIAIHYYSTVKKECVKYLEDVNKYLSGLENNDFRRPVIYQNDLHKYLNLGQTITGKLDMLTQELINEERIEFYKDLINQIDLIKCKLQRYLDKK